MPEKESKDQQCKQTQTQTQTHNQTENEIIQEKILKANGQVAMKRYRRGKILGKGGFARCYQATHVQTRKVYAIKIVNKASLKKSKAKQKLITQIKIHKLLHHKNVILFDHVFEDTENVYILLQLCNHQTLNEMIKKRKRISELELQYYLYQLIEGLIYLHSVKVIHRDLKLGNLMIGEKMEIKIGDFGLAAKLQYDSQKKKTVCGTPNYIAPEILEGKGHSYEVDIWSIGVIMYALLYGRPPFETSDIKKTYKKIKQCQYSFNDQISISSNARNIISKILVVDPSKRLTLSEILQHPFMTAQKIPKSMPYSILATPLPRDFIQQYGNCFGNNKISHSSKNIEKKGDIDLQKGKSLKGISQRLLLRTSNGFNRNFFSKPTEESSQKPHLMSNNFFNQTENNSLKQCLSQTSTILVRKWVDYSSKYGLGYLLSNGSTGIYFNDSSKIILDELNQKIDYFGKLDGNPKKLYSFSMQNVPESRQLSKKMVLMQYFRKYLNSTAIKTQSIKKKSSEPLFHYVKRWFKDQHGILFRLSNKHIQINFVDKSQIVIYGEKGILVYTGPNHNSKSYYQIGVNQISKSSQVYIKFQYAKNMLRRIKNDEQNDQLGLIEESDNLLVNNA